MKKVYKILIPCLILALLLVGGLVIWLMQKTPAQEAPENLSADAPYAYSNPEQIFPEYETDLFTLDGVADEEIYDNICWWEGIYSEGAFQKPVHVRVASYLGEKGAYFTFDVDDDKVYVNPARVSYANSGVSLYFATDGTKALKDNVWEIDIQPNNDINSKRYTGNIGFATILANGYTRRPMIATTTKGGAINTGECQGYVIETYFPYEFLLGPDYEKPEKLKLNFALNRNFSAEATKSRDLYYNFGQEDIIGWSWGNPDTWWTFEQYGLESIALHLDASAGGSFVDAPNLLQKFISHRIGVKPDDGYRLVSLSKTVGDKTEDVTDQLVWEDGISYLKVNMVREDISLKAVFEPIPSQRYTLSGKITYQGKSLPVATMNDLGVRYMDGGVAYVCDLSGEGVYSLQVPTGKGKLEIISKSGYTAKVQEVTADQDRTVDVNLTSDDYGDHRVIALSDAVVWRNGETLFEGTELLEAKSNTFAYDFTLTYDGALMGSDGKILKDPTFGNYANNFTAINIRGTFKDENGGDIASSAFQFQILHWNDDWLAKLYLDTGVSQQNISHKTLMRALNREGIRMRLLLADGKMTVYALSGNQCIKVVEQKMTATENRYLDKMTFYIDNVVRDHIWSINDQKLALGRTSADMNVKTLISVYKSTVTVAGKNSFEDFENLQLPGAWFNKYNIQYSELIDENGNVLEDATVTMRVKMQGKIFYNGLIKLTLKKGGISTFSGGLGADPWTVFEGVVLNNNQLKQLRSEEGLDLFVVHNAGEDSVTAYIQDGDGLIPAWTWQDSQELKLKGYEIQFDKDGGKATAESVIHKGSFQNAVKAKYGDAYTLDPEIRIVHSSTTNQKGINTFVDYYNSTVSGNWFNRYSIKIDDVVDENGKVLKDAIAMMRIKTVGSGGVYSSMLKLTLNANGVSLLTGTNANGPVDYNFINVMLTADQLKQLGTAEGLNLYAVHNNEGTAITVYLQDGSNLMECWTIGGSTTELLAKGYEAQCDADSFTIDVENVKHTQAFLDVAKMLYDEEFNIVEYVEIVDASVVSQDTQTVTGTNLFVDYDRDVVVGNWFYRYNIKMDDVVDENGTVLKNTEAILRIKAIGNGVYNSMLKLTLSTTGASILTGTNANGPTDYDFINVPLTAEQLKQLGTQDGLNLYAIHNAGAFTIDVYLQDGTELKPLWTVGGSTVELAAKGYELQCNAESFAINVQSVRHTSEFTKVVDAFYGDALTFYTPDDTDDIKIVSQGFQNVKDANLFIDYGDDTVSGDWFNRYNVKLDGVVDADGNILKSAKVLMRVKCVGQGGVYNTMLQLELTAGGSAIVTGTNENGPTDFNFKQTTLTAEQLKQLSTNKGMTFYAVHHKNAHSVGVYVQNGNKLDLCYVIGARSSEYDFLCKGYEAQCNVDGFAISVDSISHTGSFQNTVEKLYGETLCFDGKVMDSGSVNTANSDMVVQNSNLLIGSWYTRYNIKIDEAVDADGTILRDAEVLMRVKAYGGTDYNAMLKMTLTAGGTGILTGTNVNGATDYNFVTVQLTASQLKQLTTDEGLNLYAVHTIREKTITIYVQDGNELVPCWTIGGATKFFWYKGYEARCNVSSFEINVENVWHDAPVLDVMQTRYGKNFVIQGKTEDSEVPN